MSGCFFFGLIASWSSANQIPDTLPNQLEKVIEQLPVTQFRFSFNQESNSTETFMSVCSDKQGRYGLVPLNTTAQLCWIYDYKNEQLASTDKYDDVFESDDELNRYINIFLEYQLDANKGFWTRQQESVCYSPENGERAGNYCLKSSDEIVTEKPESSKKDSSSSAGAYSLLAAGIIITVVFLGYVECKAGCIRTSCKEYGAM